MANVEVREISWGSRLKESIKGVIGGGVLFLAAFPTLWVNEGCAVKTARDLERGQEKVVSVDAANYDAAHEGRLVHMSGEAVSQGPVSDSRFGVSVDGVRLIRTVEMRQWRENVKTTTENNTGGSQTERKEYTYEEVWSSSEINSSNFNRSYSQGRTNPGMPYESDSFQAASVQLGAYQLNDTLIGQIGGVQSVPLTAEIAGAFGPQARVEGEYIYVGSGSPSSPKIGDLRIQYEYAPSGQTVSIYAKQVGRSFDAFEEEEGTELIRLDMGKLTAPEMFAAAASENAMKTWIVRAVGFIMMWIGLALVFRPLRTVADVLPFLGKLLGFGLNFFAGIIAFALSFVTIAIAWIFYRPLLGITLLVLGVGAIVAGYIIANKKKPEPAAAA